jgi:hypothetical protein
VRQRTRHRIITVQGDTRDVVVIGERLYDNSGEVVGTQGFYIDVTPTAQHVSPAFPWLSPRSLITTPPSNSQGRADVRVPHRR